MYLLINIANTKTMLIWLVSFEYLEDTKDTSSLQPRLNNFLPAFLLL